MIISKTCLLIDHIHDFTHTYSLFSEDVVDEEWDKKLNFLPVDLPLFHGCEMLSDLDTEQLRELIYNIYKILISKPEIERTNMDNGFVSTLCLMINALMRQIEIATDSNITHITIIRTGETDLLFSYTGMMDMKFKKMVKNPFKLVVTE